MHMSADVHITTLCLKKNDTDVAHYNFNSHQPVLVMFERNVADRESTLSNSCLLSYLS